MASRTIWGSVNADGTIKSGSGGFSVTKTDPGVYVLGFESWFKDVPAVVATQNRFGNTAEWNTDGVTVPLVSEATATAITGNGSGNHGDRSFAFIAIGNI